MGFTAERFARVALTLVQSNPFLLECEPKSIAVGVIRSAQLGLSLDPLLGESYLIPRWNGKTKRMEASWQRGYRGVMKLIRRTGELSGFRADVVHKNDKFMRAANGDVFHEKAEGDRGPRTKAFVALYFKDGFVSAHDMTIEEIYAIRDRYSEGYKRFAEGKASQSPWDPGNPITEKWMLIKTVLFQAAHLAPMETEAGQQLVKEAVVDNMDGDDAMAALTGEIFDGDEPIEMKRTEERLSRTDALTQQLEAGKQSGTVASPDATGTETAAAASAETAAGEAPAANERPPAPSDPEREALSLKVVQARDNIFAKTADGDRFVAARTDGKYDSIEAITKDGSAVEIAQILADINRYADQRAKAQEK